MKWPLVIAGGLLALPVGGCGSLGFTRKQVITSFDYAQPRPGAFRYVRRDVSAVVTLDSRRWASRRDRIRRASSLVITATRELLRKVQLRENQALYNVRLSAVGIDDQYLFYMVMGFAVWWKHAHRVVITADVIQFTG